MDFGLSNLNFVYIRSNFKLKKGSLIFHTKVTLDYTVNELNRNSKENIVMLKNDKPQSIDMLPPLSPFNKNQCNPIQGSISPLTSNLNCVTPKRVSEMVVIFNKIKAINW